jgi:hemerythrin-like metal-binding protein
VRAAVPAYYNPGSSPPGHFAMDPQSLSGIEEIDAQHKEIEETARAVIEAVAARDKWHVVHYILVRLYELLRFHFAVEESVMSIVSFPDIATHKQVHREILAMVERLKAASLDPQSCGHDESMETQFGFLTRIVDHDKSFDDFVVANIPGLRN